MSYLYHAKRVIAFLVLAVLLVLPLSSHVFADTLPDYPQFDATLASNYLTQLKALEETPAVHDVRFSGYTNGLDWDSSTLSIALLQNGLDTDRPTLYGTNTIVLSDAPIRFFWQSPTDVMVIVSGSNYYVGQINSTGDIVAPSTAYNGSGNLSYFQKITVFHPHDCTDFSNCNASQATVSQNMPHQANSPIAALNVVSTPPPTPTPTPTPIPSSPPTSTDVTSRDVHLIGLCISLVIAAFIINAFRWKANT
jgi:hypothetical protein